MRRPTVLVLTASYGNGHLQVANVIAEEINKKGFEPIVSDLFGESYPAISTFTQSLLIKSFSYGQSFYKWFYYGTNKLNSKGIAQFSRYLGRKRLMELMAEYRPIFVISTFPLHSVPFLIKNSSLSIPTYTVITDYCVHPYWVNPIIDHYFVCSENVKISLLKQNIKETQITVSGIPIRPQFDKPMDKRAIFQKYLLSPHKKVITVFAGAHGVLKKVKELCQLLLQNPSLQVVTICGNNESLYEKLLPLAYQFPDSFRLFGYVEEIHELFVVSNCLITKPGGITLTEAASLKVPLILFKPVPGQEAENAKYFAEKGAALISTSIKETFELVQRLSRDKEFSNKMKTGLTSIHQAYSASTITDYAIKQIQKPSEKVR